MTDLPAVIKQAFIDAGAIYDTEAPAANVLAAVAEAVAAERERCATGPGTPMGRIAALEARYAELLERMDRFEREVLEAAWALKRICGETTSYQPITKNHTHTVTCRRPAGHDGMHEGEGFGNASVLWDAHDPPKRDPASTTGGGAVIRNTPNLPTGFGFGRVAAAMGPERPETAQEPLTASQADSGSPSVSTGRTERPGGAR